MVFSVVSPRIYGGLSGQAAQREPQGGSPLKKNARFICRKKFKKLEIVVDTSNATRLYTPHQRGRCAAGDSEVRFRKSLEEKFKRAA